MAEAPFLLVSLLAPPRDDELGVHRDSPTGPSQMLERPCSAPAALAQLWEPLLWSAWAAGEVWGELGGGGLNTDQATYTGG